MYVVWLTGVQALAQTGTKSVVADGAILCGDRDAAVEVINILRDPDSEAAVRRLLSMFSSGECREFGRSETYGTVEVEPPGIVKIRLHSHLTAYLAVLSLSSR